MNKNKGTILYIGGFELPDRNAAAHRVIANGKMFDEIGYEVIYDGITKSETEYTDLENSKKYFGFTSYARKYPDGYRKWFGYIVQLKRYKKLIEKHDIDIIVCYNFPSFSLLRLLKFCQKKGVKLLADSTEWDTPDSGFSFIRRYVKKIDIYLRMKIIHPKLDGLIVISEYLLEYYKDKSERLIKIPPLVDFSIQKWKSIEPKIDINNITLVYAGSIGIRRRIDRIIDAISRINAICDKQVNLKVIGSTKSDFVDSFGEEALPSNIDEFVTFKGRIPHEYVLKEISQSHFEIFIRDYSLTNNAGFPSKFVESISCGTPVLSNVPTSMNQYFIEGKTGFFIDPTTNTSLEESLLRALSANKESIMNMKRFCRSSSMFSYKNYIDSILNFMDELLT